MRVLILAPWPLRVPRHGGQLRGSAVAQAYRDGGHDVHTISFYDSSQTKPDDLWPDDLDPLTQDVTDLMQTLASASEMNAWRAMATEPNSFDRVVAALRRLRPDLLQFEEPVFWPLVKRLQAEGHLYRVAVAHSSYNFETLAWRLRGTLGAPVVEETVLDIAVFESEIALCCDVVFAVSQADAYEFRKLGAKFVQVAENGVSSLEFDVTHSLSDYLPSGLRYALFVSSAHPPNAAGFIDLAEHAQGHPLGDGDLLICGKVGPMIQVTLGPHRARRILDRSRILGWVDDRLLRALYASCQVVILPKTHGGGSNLKTAEALASGRPVVATRNAFIGFERFMDLPGIFIADEPDVFWQHVSEHLSASLVSESRRPETMSGLLWSECLKPMVCEGENAVRRVQKP